MTASRIPRPEYSYSNPVQSITGEQILGSGVRDIGQFLKQIPALSGTITKNDTAGGDAVGTNGLVALDLHNLGFVRTLVLVNGRRYVSSPIPGASAVDIDTLPTNLIERVEVMTGGASALYGADGVSGVVNFVMKDRYEGFEVTAQTAASSKHDAQSQTTSLTYGKPFAGDRGHFSFGLDYTNDQRLSRQRRENSSRQGYARFVQNPDNPGGINDSLPDRVPLNDLRFFDFSPGGAVDLDFQGSPEFNGDGTPWQAGRSVPPSYDQGGDGTRVADFLPDVLPAEEKYNVSTFVNFDLTDKMRIFSEFSYNKRDSLGEFTPTFDSILVFFPGSAYTPASIEAAAAGSFFIVTRDNFDLGIRTDNTERETYRGLLGLEGSINDNLHFEVSYTYGETAVETNWLNNRYNDRYAAALDAVVDPDTGEVVCASELDPSAEPFNLEFQGWNRFTPLPGTWAGSFTPGVGDCVPINIFGEGSPSHEAINWVMTDSRATHNMKQQVAQVRLGGDSAPWFELPAGSVGFVVGAEWRNERVSVNPAEEDRLGLTFANTFDGERGSLNVAEVFVEVDVPLLAKRKFAEFLALDAAVRYSDYSTVGHATTWKTGIVWQPWPSLTLRGTLAEATRAPSLGELKAPLGQTFADFDDPCDINNLVNGTEFRRDNCAALLTALGVDPTAYVTPNGLSVSGLNGGNSNLEKETADTLTWGFIYRPKFIEGLVLSADWYDIELQGAISFAEPQDAAQLCVDLPTLTNDFCNLIDRGPDGGISGFTQLPQNVASFSTRGVDFNVSYSLELHRLGFSERWGSLQFDLSGNKLGELKIVSLPGAPPVSQLGQKNAPEWQANTDVRWQFANSVLRWQVHYFDETNRFDDVTTRNNPNIVARRYLQYNRKLTHDLYASHRFGDGLMVYVGVNNVTGEKPDLGETFYPVSAVGRYLYAGLNFAL